MGIVSGGEEDQDQRQLVGWELGHKIGHGFIDAGSLRLGNGNARRTAKPKVGLPHSVSPLEDRPGLTP
ncbi:hypothetical protein GCM10007857_25680 [Bradyrhizobium iriomotense]|uniref:Uncharacterized protein n=1 Tax=Bradyrhizobium iriomotense TaxID=441950 RepID=A0ABQ6AUI3_9BRAD|nr:hypothetical protein GCM10007857_25680 [Bradyrhizobium iriomotense]